MRSERWLKPFVQIVVVLAIVAVAICALLYYEIDAWRKMRSDLNVHFAVTAAPQATPTPAPEAPEEQVAAVAPTPRPTPLHVRAAPLDTMTLYLIDRFATNNGRIDVCSMLPNQPTPAHKPPTNGQPSADPAVESAFMPLAHFLELPSVQRVAIALANAHQSGDASEIGAPEFRQQIDAAAAEVTTHQAELVTSSQAAYNLFALSRAVEMVPQMGTDSNVQDFCSRQQDLALGSSTQSQEQIGEDKSQLFRILSNAGLGPEDVEYDASTGGQIEALANLQGIKFASTWLSMVSGGDLEITNPLAAPETTSGTTSAPDANRSRQ